MCIRDSNQTKQIAVRIFFAKIYYKFFIFTRVKKQTQTNKWYMVNIVSKCNMCAFVRYIQKFKFVKLCSTSILFKQKQIVWKTCKTFILNIDLVYVKF